MKPDTKGQILHGPTDKSSHIKRPRGSEGSCPGLGREMEITVNGHRILGYKDEKVRDMASGDGYTTV